jgi:hypothetical protein
MSILLMVFEIIAAFFSITNSNPSLLISFTVSLLFIFALPSSSISVYMYENFGAGAPLGLWLALSLRSLICWERDEKI